MINQVVDNISESIVNELSGKSLYDFDSVRTLVKSHFSIAISNYLDTTRTDLEKRREALVIRFNEAQDRGEYVEDIKRELSSIKKKLRPLNKLYYEQRMESDLTKMKTFIYTEYGKEKLKEIIGE